MRCETYARNQVFVIMNRSQIRHDLLYARKTACAAGRAAPAQSGFPNSARTWSAARGFGAPAGLTSRDAHTVSGRDCSRTTRDSAETAGDAAAGGASAG